MNRRVEDLDDLTVDLDGIGDINDTLERRADRFGDGRLAVPRRAIEQHGAAGVHRRAEMVDEPVGQDQMGNIPRQDFLADPFGAHRLAFYLVTISRERHRRGADILALFQRLGRPVPSLAGQREAKLRRQHRAARTENLQQALIAGRIQYLVRYRRRQLESRRHFGRHFITVHVHQF